MVGKIFITRTGYDPQLGKHVKDPYLGPSPSMGACRPDIRRSLKKGDHLFVISGKVPSVNQFVMGGFEVNSKVHAIEAYKLFPEQRLHVRNDGQLDGNVIVRADGRQHKLDDHSSFDKRVQDYLIGTNLIALSTPEEIERGRRETLDALRDILQRKGNSPFAVVGHWGSPLTEKQVLQLREWLESLKNSSN
jgi:hypothetical protein